jgi:hypothetical protein
MEVIEMFDPWLIAVVVAMIALVVLSSFFARGEKPNKTQAKRPPERRESPPKAA